MEKSKINFIVDACMLLGGASLAGIGLMMKYVLLPGKERMALYGRNVNLTLFGLDRHEWGTIHLWLAYGISALLLVHLALHLQWIAAMVKKLVRQRWQYTLTILFVLLCLALVVAPFFVTPQISATGPDAEHAPFIGKGSGRGMMPGRNR